MNTTSSQWRPLQEDGGQREWRVQIDVPEAENNDPTWSDWIHLVFGAVRRRWLLFGILFLSGMTASLQYYRSRPPLYRTEARIFAQPPQPLSGPAHPTIADDVPTHQAWNLVHQRKNLIELIKEAKLLEPWRARTRQNHQWWSRWLPFQRAEEDSLNDLVGELDQDLLVTTAEETIRISIDWPDPEEAYRIVHGALQNFFEARHLKEITAFDEVISLLRGRAAALREQLDKVVQESRGVSSQGWEFTNTSNAASRKPVEELERLRATIDAKNRAIWDVEEFRRRRLADLQAQLEEKRGIYSDAYPSVIALQEDIAALSRESPQITSLRAEERKLREEYAAKAAAAEVEPRPLPAARGAFSRPGDTRVPDTERIRDARLQYTQMVERLSAAQLELDAARAGFKYRYTIIWPPEVPKHRVSPLPRKIFSVGGLLSLLLAAVVVVALDLLRGRVVQPWQLQKSLELPVLADAREYPRAPRRDAMHPDW